MRYHPITGVPMTDDGEFVAHAHTDYLVIQRQLIQTNMQLLEEQRDKLPERYTRRRNRHGYTPRRQSAA